MFKKLLTSKSNSIILQEILEVEFLLNSEVLKPFQQVEPSQNSHKSSVSSHSTMEQMLLKSNNYLLWLKNFQSLQLFDHQVSKQKTIKIPWKDQAFCLFSHSLLPFSLINKSISFKQLQNSCWISSFVIHFPHCNKSLSDLLFIVTTRFKTFMSLRSSNKSLKNNNKSKQLNVLPFYKFNISNLILPILLSFHPIKNLIHKKWTKLKHIFTHLR